MHSTLSLMVLLTISSRFFLAEGEALFCSSNSSPAETKAIARLSLKAWSSVTATDVACLTRRALIGFDHENTNSPAVSGLVKEKNELLGSSGSESGFPSGQVRDARQRTERNSPLDLKTISDLGKKLNSCSASNHCCRGLTWKVFKSRKSSGSPDETNVEGSSLFPLNQIEFLSPGCLLDFSKHEEKSIHHLTPDQLKALNPTVLKEMDKAHFEELPALLCGALTPHQVAALSENANSFCPTLTPGCAVMLPTSPEGRPGNILRFVANLCSESRDLSRNALVAPTPTQHIMWSLLCNTNCSSKFSTDTHADECKARLGPHFVCFPKKSALPSSGRRGGGVGTGSGAGVSESGGGGGLPVESSPSPTQQMVPQRRIHRLRSPTGGEENLNIQIQAPGSASGGTLIPKSLGSSRESGTGAFSLVIVFAFIVVAAGFVAKMRRDSDGRASKRRTATEGQALVGVSGGGSTTTASQHHSSKLAKYYEEESSDDDGDDNGKDFHAHHKKKSSSTGSKKQKQKENDDGKYVIYASPTKR